MRSMRLRTNAFELLQQSSNAADFQGELARDLQHCKIFAKTSQSECGILRKPDVRGSATERLNANRSGAGIEIDETATGDARRKDVEEGLAQPVAGGTSLHSVRSGELTGAIGSGDDTHP